MKEKKSMYKILILKNGKNIDVQSERQYAKQYFQNHKLQMEYIEKEIDIPVSWSLYKTVPGFSSKTGKPIMVKYFGLDTGVKNKVRTIVKEGEYDFLFIVNDISKIKTREGESYSVNWTNYDPLYPDTEYIQIIYNEYLKQQGKVRSAFIHETMHGLINKANRAGYPAQDFMDTDSQGRAFYRNDYPNDPTSNFGQTWEQLKPYLNRKVTENKQSIIDAIIAKIAELRAKLALVKEQEAKKKYKYFTEQEVKGLTDGFVKILDKSREYSDTPWVLTSTYRKGESNHGAGLGTDARCKGTILYGLVKHLRDSGKTGKQVYEAVSLLRDSSILKEDKQAQMVFGAMRAGIKRIGVYDKHIHVDIVTGKAEPTIWYGKSK